MDYEKIEQKLRTMKPRQKLYELVKAEMVRRGRWKSARRGSEFKAGHDERRAKLKPQK
jgi:hypothetical protein